MLKRPVVVSLLVIPLCFGGGCTKENPSYVPVEDQRGVVVFDQGGGGREMSVPVDGPAPRVDGPVTPADGPVPPDLGQPDKPPTSPGCPPGQLKCNGRCRNVLTDRYHCGKCDNRCGWGRVCTSGLCCSPGWVNCSGKCVDVGRDSKNCGKCGVVCPSGVNCQAGTCLKDVACADGSTEQVFGAGMQGCAGREPFSRRDRLCASSHKVCSAAEWVKNRNNIRPVFNYWTDDNLRYNGSERSCWVSTTQGQVCSNGAEPMRVCAGSWDALGNRCNWTNCGYTKAQPNAYFGGCQRNNTAGALCCPK